MNHFLVLGADTDVGKTTFALLWLQLFADRWEYWKPIETGASDSESVARLCPSARIHAPYLRFAAPLAPPLAASQEKAIIPRASVIASAIPQPVSEHQGLLIESFGSPFSPVNDNELQLALIRALDTPCVLISASKLGGIGRALQCLAALRAEAIDPIAVVLMGENDEFTQAKVRQHARDVCVVSITPPEAWTTEALAESAARQRETLESVRTLISSARKTRFAGAQTLTAEDRRCVWHPYTPLVGVDDALACVGAQNEFLQLADGRRVIDAISSWWTILFGHRHPPLIKALAEASGRLDHVLFAGVTHSHAIELADLLLGTMPWVGGRVFYSDNGSTAVEVGLKMAYQYWCHQGEPQRLRFIGFENGYHGDTFGAMSVGRDPVFFGRFEPLMFRAEHLPLDPVRLDAHLQQHASETAAVILEPLVQGAGGMQMHAPETLRLVVDITQRHGVLFIADEVMTGGGRTGTLWAHQAAGAIPDFVCAAKTLTGGVLPLAATLVAPRIVDAFLSADRSRTFFHGHSFTANPLACAVAACNLRLLLEKPVSDPIRIERFWQDAFRDLSRQPHIKDVRIRGSVAAIELDVPSGYLADVGDRMRRQCLELGVFLRPLGNVLYAMPPYCTCEASLTRIADAMHAALKSVQSG